MDDQSDMSPENLVRLAFGDDELAGLTAIRALRTELAEREDVLVLSARVSRRTWSEIGAAIGTTRQGAYNRFGDKVRQYDPSGALDSDPE